MVENANLTQRDTISEIIHSRWQTAKKTKKCMC